MGFHCRGHKKERGVYLENQNDVFRENFFTQNEKSFFQTKNVICILFEIDAPRK